MAWKLLPTDYTDAVWSGLKRYTQVDNSDGTVSFNDVTTYTNITDVQVALAEVYEMVLGGN